MATAKINPIRTCHVVAMPYPGRGHVNPMMNLCKLLSDSKPDLLITFVVTEEWLGFIGAEPKPENVRFRTIPNVIPSEIGRAKDFVGFLEAVSTKMAAPFERLLDRLEPPVTAIVADTYLVWMVELANRRNTPVASLWTMSASVLSVFHHFDLLRRNNHFPADLSEQGDEIVDYIPGFSPTRLTDLPSIFYGNGKLCLKCALECISWVPKVQYLLFTSFYELEYEAFDVFKKELSLPVYPIGPSIPHFKVAHNDVEAKAPDYIKWLDSKPRGSVLYVSLGSFLSVSSSPMDEIMAGVCNSGVPYLVVARGETSSSWVRDGCDDVAMVVSWCDQLKVLCHPSIGGFWTHCGWNSTLESVFAGVPMLTFPIFWDQIPNSKAIVEDWKIGWRVRKDVTGQTLVTREEIAKLLQTFMDPKNEEVKEMRKRAEEMKEICGHAIAKGGSSQANIEAFIKGISNNKDTF